MPARNGDGPRRILRRASVWVRHAIVRVFSVPSLLIACLLALTGFPVGAAGDGVSTLITPGVALGPVRLGMSITQVAASLGHPTTVQGAQLEFRRWAMTVGFQNGAVARISTTNPLFRTRRGAGVGISRLQATHLVGDQNEFLTTIGGSLTVLYPLEGIGFVFRGSRAAEVFIQPPLKINPSIARVGPGASSSSQPSQPSTTSVVGGANAYAGGGPGGGGGAGGGGGTGGGTGGGGAGGGGGGASGSSTGSGGTGSGSASGAGTSTPTGSTSGTDAGSGAGAAGGGGTSSGGTGGGGAGASGGSTGSGSTGGGGTSDATGGTSGTGTGSTDGSSTSTSSTASSTTGSMTMTSTTTSSTNPTGLSLIRSYTIPQGNAAHLVWSDDGSAVYLADEEGWMSTVKINASTPAHPVISATNGSSNYVWATDQRSGLLVFQTSIGGTTLRIDPVTFKTVWQVSTGTTHDIATDGSRAFVPLEGTPGTLVVLGPDGSTQARVMQSDGWASVYGIAYDAGTRRLYISSSADSSRGIPGGIYIYDVSQTTPAYLGKISQPSSDIAVRGTRLWRQSGPTLQAWDVSSPASPILLGSWTAPVVSGPGGTLVRDNLGNMTANPTGTRLYIVYNPVTASAGNQVLDWPAGFMIFDVSGTTPQLLTQQSWPANKPYYEQPLAVSLSPDASTLAVSYWAFGVRLYGVANDTVTPLGTVATTGEAHDVYVDDGIIYVFAHDDIQILDPATGAHIQDIPIVGMVVDGGWAPFLAGIILPGPAPSVLRIATGGIVYQQTLPGFPTFTWSVRWDGGNYLYSGTEDGTIYVTQVALTSTYAYTSTPVSSVRIPRADGTYGEAPLLAMGLQGTTLWALGPTVGVVAVDVSIPSAPRIIYHDNFTFDVNGNHAGMVVAQNRVYAGAGSIGLRIYNPSNFTLTGTIPGYNVNFLDTIGNTFLVLSNYWYAAHPDGVYLFNIVANPDAPSLVDWFPQPSGNANFRARAVGTLVYRVPLYGIDVLQTPSSTALSPTVTPDRLMDRAQNTRFNNPEDIWALVDAHGSCGMTESNDRRNDSLRDLAFVKEDMRLSGRSTLLQPDAPVP
jgi:hypothetical protein